MKTGISTGAIFKIAVPLIIQQFSGQLQIFADRAMLGHVNSEYFSAVGNATIPYYTVTSVIFAICGGTTILVAQNFGASDTTSCRRYAESSFMGNFILSLLCFALFFFGSGLMFRLMGVESPILEYSESFLRIISFTLIGMGITFTAVSLMQGVGRTKIIMITGAVANILNIFLDWCLIFGNLGFPRLGIEGAAYATLISNFAAAPIILIYVFVSRNIPVRLRFRNVFRFHWRAYKTVLKLGAPAVLESALWNVGNLIVISFLNRLNIMAVGIYTLIFSLELLPMLIYTGFANAALTLVGHKTGADAHEHAVSIGFQCLRLSLLVCVVVALLFLTLPKELLGIFTNDRSMVEYAAPFLMLIAASMFPRSVNNVIGPGIRGMGDTRWMLYGQIGGTALVIALAYALIFPAGLGLWGLFLAFLVDETIRGFINLMRFWKGREVFRLKPFKKIS